MGRKWTEEEEKFVRENYLTMAHKEIGKKINRSQFAISGWCSKNNCVGQSGRHQLDYTVFSDYFKDENALSVGLRLFITADGNTRQVSKNSYRLTISLKLEDEAYLIRIRDELAPDRPLTYGMAKLKGKEYPCVTFQIYDKELVKNLIEDWGVEPAKSKNHKFRYTACADEFKPDALRCLFDGDGCINVCRTKKGNYITHCFKIASSSKLFLEDIQRELGFGYGKIYHCGKDKNGKDKNCWEWKVQKRQEIQYLYRFMYYNDDVFCLKRKKVKFKPIMEAGISRTHWSDKEIKFLQENWKKMDAKQLAKKLNRTIISIEYKKRKLSHGKVN